MKNIYITGNLIDKNLVDEESLEKISEFLTNNCKEEFEILPLDELCEKLNIDYEEDMFLESKSEVKYEPETGKYQIKVDGTNVDYINRFTLLHEIAHVLYEAEELKRGGVLQSNYIENEHWYSEEEARANNFAATILVPKSYLSKHIAEFINENKDAGPIEFINIYYMKYNVSREVLENRMKALGYIK